MRVYPLVKRASDAIGAAILIVISAPLALAATLAVHLSMGSPVVFRQERPGLGKQPFNLLKFRTMTDRRNDKGDLLPDEQRLTRVGVFLRKSSIDELPQLVNILRGEMSFIGPRPLLTRYLPYYTPEETMRFNVRPGITGLAQINGRNSVRWDERLSLDVEYVDALSPLTDLKILLQTIRTVIFRDGVIEAPTTAMLSLDVERSKTCPVHEDGS